MSSKIIFFWIAIAVKSFSNALTNFPLSLTSLPKLSLRVYKTWNLNMLGSNLLAACIFSWFFCPKWQNLWIFLCAMWKFSVLLLSCSGNLGHHNHDVQKGIVFSKAYAMLSDHQCNVLEMHAWQINIWDTNYCISLFLTVLHLPLTEPKVIDKYITLWDIAKYTPVALSDCSRIFKHSPFTMSPWICWIYLTVLDITSKL